MRGLACAWAIILITLSTACTPPPDLGDGPGQEVPVDADGDGVPDADDRCPLTTRDAVVDAVGCAAVQRDGDDDGITDDRDECPETGAGTTVGANGCALVVKPADGDGDGVTDDRDECPGTGNGTSVGANGCPIVITPTDADGDGVANSHDDCPGTQRGLTVDANGCAPNQRDSDGDGMTDNRDRCAATPPESVIDSRGCAASQRDGDRDGVTDDRDDCADTALAAVVDVRGCSDVQRDSDGDGVNDAIDACSFTGTGLAVGTDGCPPAIGGGGGGGGGGGASSGNECAVPGDCNDQNACTTESCANGFCGHATIPDCVPCNVPPICPLVDVVFIMDTSGSMTDEAVALCTGVGQFVTALGALGITVQPTFLGITQNPGGPFTPFTCLTSNVVALLGPAVPGNASACPFPGTLSAFESWGPATAIVAERFAWTSGARRIIVPLSDEGPCNGNLPEGCNDPGDDRDSISNAIAIATQHHAAISPVTGTGSNSCVINLASAAALGTGGTAFNSTDPVADLADAIYALILQSCDPGACDDDNACTLNDVCGGGVCAGAALPNCVPCRADGDCGDSNACTDDICTAGVCENPVNFDASMQCCDPSTGATTPLQDGDPCTEDLCDAETGVVTHPPAAKGQSCDDGVICTVNDVCDGMGACTGADVESIPCNSDDDCLITLCNTQTGFCDCIEAPTLCLEAVGPPTESDHCFDLNEIVTIHVKLGFGVHPVAAGQVSIGFDPTKFEFVSMEPGSFDDPASPFSIEVSEVVDELAGEVVYGVAAALGHPGAHGPTTLAVLRLKVIASCTDASVCYLDDRGGTFLTDSMGDPIDYVGCCTGTFSIGQSAPTLICPPGASRNADAGRTTTTINWPAPQASASCGSTALLACSGTSSTGISLNAVVAQGGLLPIGLHQFSCTATDDCGQQTTCNWNVHIHNAHEVIVDLQYSPTMFNAAVERCIEFEFYASCIEATTVITQDVTFGPPFDFAGYARGVPFKVPANNYACVTARDVNHTLRSSFDLQIENGKYFAQFLGDPILGGNWLVAGNLNGDHIIDILDYVTLAGQVATIQDLHTPCGYQGYHGDINGDGEVTAVDLSFITRHFLKEDKNACCPGGGSALAAMNPPGIEAISVAQLQAMGWGELAAADINGDGIINFVDMELFDAGVTGRAGSTKRVP